MLNHSQHLPDHLSEVSAMSPDEIDGTPGWVLRAMSIKALWIDMQVFSIFRNDIRYFNPTFYNDGSLV